MAGRVQSGRAPAGQAWTVALVSTGVLLFCWPFVRTPPLGLLPSYLHLLGAWLLVIAGVALSARALRHDGSRRDA